MRLLAILTVAGCALTAAAQDFQLQGSAGELTGPFHFREGETVQVGTNTARLVNIRLHDDEILNAMEAIRIPEIEFRQANLRDVITFLVQQSVEFSADQRGITMILKQDDWMPPVHADCFCANTNGIPVGDPFAVDTNHVHDTSTETPLITFSAIDITLKEALDIVVEIANYKYRIRDGVVMIMPWNVLDEPIEVRLYDVLPTSISRLQDLRSVFSDKQPDGGYEGEDELKLFFSEMGVDWPTGSRIKHIRGLGKLAVGNTEENLEVFENVLSILNLQPYQLELELVFLACDRRQISALGPDGVSAAALMALWTNGAAELLASPKVLTQSGQEATIRGGTECIYPTTFEVCSAVATTNNPANGTATASAFMVEPQDFATRELGASFKATAEVSLAGEPLRQDKQPCVNLERM